MVTPVIWLSRLKAASAMSSALISTTLKPCGPLLGLAGFRQVEQLQLGRLDLLDRRDLEPEDIGCR